MKPALPILFEDEYLVVVHKPARLLSAPDRFDAGLPHLRSLLKGRYGPLYLVHRLDRDTSGLMVLARSPEVQAGLSRQFEQRKVKKIYWALVKGRPDEEGGEIDKPLAPHPGKAGRMVVSSKGKEARSRYRLLEAFSTASLLEVELLTGRTH
jgi:23S rRNA pseudouridine955/2504/2580 synthase/23S rRNA pseudouridine1911/1915/1917 synthase